MKLGSIVDDLKGLILQNEFGLEQSKVMALVTAVNARQAHYLSPDKEAGLFLLFALGKTLSDIAIETSYPLDLVILTALYYRWPQKATALGLVGEDKSTEEVQKDLLKSVLVATSISVKKQLGDIIAGRADASKNGLIPRNIAGLKQLMETINGMSEKGSEAGTVVNATNVQIVNNGVGEVDGKSKIERLRLIAAQRKKNNE